MVNEEIAQIFDRIADILEIKGDNPFRIRAYRKAALVIQGLADDAGKLIETGELKGMPGIGKDLYAKIEEYIHTGRMASYENLRKELPEGVLNILYIPGMGPKTAKLLYETFGIDSVEQLENYARSGRIKGVKGIKDKTVDNILKGIALKKSIQGRFSLGAALPVSEAVIEELKTAEGIGNIEVAGSIRRRKETVGDIDILVTSDDPPPLMDGFISLKEVERVLSHGSTKSSVILKNTHIQVDVRVVEKGSFGAALAYFTGSKAHNIKLREIAAKKGYKLNEYGLFSLKSDKKLAGVTEQEIYDALGLQRLPPEIREDQGEIELAAEYKLPELIVDKDIKGDVHIHTVYSDGDRTIEQMAEHAQSLNYEYIVITDHSQSLGIAGGLGPERLRTQIKEINELNQTLTDIKIMKGMEVDILSDGSLDMDAELLDKLDLVIGSIHTGFKQSKERITGRIIKAMESGFVDLIGHPSGRLIGERDAYEVDWDVVFKAAKKHKVAMEINSYPLRLDLTDIMIKKARSYGLKFMIATDSHDPKQMRYMGYGVSVARRGWLSRNDVVNTKNYGDFIKWLKGDR